LVDVVVGHLVDLTILAGHLSKLIRWDHEVVLLSSSEITCVEWLLSVVLCMIDDVLNTLVQILGVITLGCGCLVGREALLWHVDLMLGHLVLMLHLGELTIVQQLVRYIYNSRCLLIFGCNHIVILFLIILIVILIYFILLILI